MVMEILENEEELIEKIVSGSDLDREELEDKIKKKQEEYGGLLTKSGAAYSIAKDMDIDLGLKEESLPITEIKELEPDLGQANVRGVVKKITAVREWEKDDKKGKVASIEILDNSGETRVSFWNDNCEMLKKIKIGDNIELHNVLIKKREDKIELSFGRGSNMVTKKNSEGTPEFKEEIITLKELKKDLKDVNCFVRIVRVFPTNTFKKKDGREGKVTNIIVTDGKESRLVLWGEQTEWAKKLKANDIVKVENAYVKDNNGKLELNMGWNSRLLKNPKNAPSLPDAENPKEKREKISELKEGEYAEVRAVIVNAYEPTLFEICPKCKKRVEGKCKCGEKAEKRMVLNTELDDGSGVIRGVFFTESAQEILGMDPLHLEEKGCDINKILGIEKVFQGQTRRNQRLERKELIVRRVMDVDVEAEIKSLKGV